MFFDGRHLWGCLLFLLIPGCGDGGDAAPAASNGPADVASAVSHSLPAGWEVCHLHTVGSRDGDPVTTFGSVSSIEIDPSGRLHVLDGTASVVRTFDPEGRFERTIGHEGGGDGPGEFRGGGGLLALDSHEIWVYDSRNYRYVAYGPDGEPLATYDRRPLQVGGSTRLMWQSGDLVYQPTTILHPETQAAEVVLLGFGLREGRLTAPDTLPYPSTDAPRWSVGASPGPGGAVEAGRIPVPFHPSTHMVPDPREGFWWGSSDEYRFVRVSREGDTLQVIEPDVAPPPAVQSSDIERAVEALSERVQAQISADTELAPEVFFLTGRPSWWTAPAASGSSAIAHPGPSRD